MNNTLISFIAILFLAGCVSTLRTQPVLFQTYSQYKESTNKNNIKVVAKDYFSQSLLGEKYLANPDSTKQLLFKNYMVTIANHFERVNIKYGCLSINGYDEENAPLIFSLKYMLTNGQWLIDKIHVVFIENKKDFSTNAKCPESYGN